jgi:hypothetical protein
MYSTVSLIFFLSAGPKNDRPLVFAFDTNWQGRKEFGNLSPFLRHVCLISSRKNNNIFLQKSLKPSGILFT